MQHESCAKRIRLTAWLNKLFTKIMKKLKAIIQEKRDWSNKWTKQTILHKNAKRRRQVAVEHLIGFHSNLFSI